MNGFALSNISILVHDGNNRTTLGLNNTTNSHNREVGELMIINPTHINSTGILRLVNNAHIIASQTTIGTTVNKRAIGTGFMFGSAISNLMNMATQDASDVSRKAMIGGRGLGRTGRLLGLLGSMGHKSGGVTLEGAVLRRSRQGRSLTRIRGRWKEGHISGAGVVLMDLDNIQVVSQTEIMEIQTPSQIWS